MKPFWERDGFLIFHGDAAEIAPALPTPDHVLTDPPYDEQTHAGARGGGDGERVLVTFEHASLDDVRGVLAALNPRRWTVATMAIQHVAALEREPPAGMRFVRFGAWVKPNGAPQFTGDRPAQGWEAVAILHRAGARSTWNGGGLPAVWTIPKINGAHETEKPIRLLRTWIEQFTTPGDVIVDPWMGSGTTLRAAKDCGRLAVGIEIDERWCEHAARRMEQETLPLV